MTRFGTFHVISPPGEVFNSHKSRRIEPMTRSAKAFCQGERGALLLDGRHVLRVDELPAVGGGDAGPDPYELLLMALGAGTSMPLARAGHSRLPAVATKVGIPNLRAVEEHRGRVVQHDPAGLEHVAAVGDAERHARILFDE